MENPRQTSSPVPGEKKDRSKRMSTSCALTGEGKLETANFLQPRPSISLGNPGMLRDVIVERARELFTQCDPEDKGFITKRCMQRLNGELPLGPDQLEQVFDTLDTDKNGFLTLEEFTDGFGMFMGIDTKPRRISHVVPEDIVKVQETMKKSAWTPEETAGAEEEDELFEEFLDSLGVHDCFKDEEYVKLIWSHLRKENPDMLENFEEFLCKVTGNIRNSEKECSSLETALINRKNEQEQQVQRLYEEMEQQIRAEKERVLNEERARERRLREELEIALQEKNKLLHELQDKQHQMESQLQCINSSESETKLKNVKLEKERDRLNERLRDTERIVEEMQNHMEKMRQQALDEKRLRAKTVLEASEQVALERESLIQQLEMLRQMNKQLLDQKDEINMFLLKSSSSADTQERLSDLGSEKRSSGFPSMQSTTTDLDEQEYRRPRKGSRISDYIQSTLPPLARCHRANSEECEVDETFFEMHGAKFDSPIIEMNDSGQESLRTSPSDPQLGGRALKRQETYASENTLSSLSPSAYIDEKSIWAVHGYQTTPYNAEMDQPQSIISTYSSRTQNGPIQTIHTTSLVHPERVFKIVIVGDSSVGKSSFVRRFAYNTFQESFAATVGVDFQVKSVSVDGRSVALQLWDTAGQERFRSITKQYFRKTDGVIVVYDVTSENSFKNVRSWMCSVQDGVSSEVALMILGNKADLRSNSASRVISHSEGEKLSHEYQALFYETSAKTGLNINKCMEHMASILRIREDEEIEKTLRLQAQEGKKSQCCGKSS